jgi:hypothetical protein
VSVRRGRVRSLVRRLLGQTLRHQHALALTTGQIVELARSEVLDCHPVESPIDSDSVLRPKGAEQSQPRVAGQRDRVADRDGQALVDVGRLQDQRGRRAGDVTRSSGGFDCPSECGEQCGLAGAIGVQSLPVTSRAALSGRHRTERPHRHSGSRGCRP